MTYSARVRSLVADAETVRIIHPELVVSKKRCATRIWMVARIGDTLLIVCI